jgi:hypothetical protein
VNIKTANPAKTNNILFLISGILKALIKAASNYITSAFPPTAPIFSRADLENL